jgi:hypothetical protein
MSLWTKYAPSILLFAFVISLYAVPAVIDGYRKFKKGRQLARQIEGEKAARAFLREDWKERHGS